MCIGCLFIDEFSELKDLFGGYLFREFDKFIGMLIFPLPLEEG